MSGSLEISLEARQLEVKLYELSRRVGLELGPIIREESKYLIASAVRNTPPPSRQAGVNTIRTDLNRVAVPLNYQAFEAKATTNGFYPSIAKYVRTKNAGKLRELLQNPNLNLFRGFKVLGNPADIKAEHKARRLNGRVTKVEAKAVAFRADMRSYFRDVSKRVGFALSGWTNAANVHGIKIKKFAQGSYAGSRAGAEYSFGRNPFFIARNGNIKDFALQKKIETAVKYRLRVTITKVERAEKKLAINLGFTKLAAGSY
jgi:hypothetical protein